MKINIKSVENINALFKTVGEYENTAQEKYDHKVRSSSPEMKLAKTTCIIITNHHKTKHTETLMAKAKTHSDAGQTTQAFKYYKSAAKESLSDLWFQLAQRCKGNTEALSICYENIANLRNTSHGAIAHNRLGIIHEHTHPQKSLRHFLHAKTILTHQLSPLSPAEQEKELMISEAGIYKVNSGTPKTTSKTEQPEQKTRTLTSAKSMVYRQKHKDMVRSTLKIKQPEPKTGIAKLLSTFSCFRAEPDQIPRPHRSIKSSKVRLNIAHK